MTLWVNGETGITVQGFDSNFQDSHNYTLTIWRVSENIKPNICIFHKKKLWMTPGNAQKMWMIKTHTSVYTICSPFSKIYFKKKLK